MTWQKDNDCLRINATREHLNILGLKEIPVFCGTWVPVKNLFDYLETGETVNDFLRDFDSVQPYQAMRVLEMSKKLIEKYRHLLSKYCL